MKRCLIVFLLLIACQMQKKWDFAFPIVGLALDGFPVTEQMIHQSLEETKIVPSVFAFYVQWPSPSDIQQTILPSLETIWNNHSVPCLTWEPMTIESNVEKVIPYQDILDGKYDRYLGLIASEIKTWNKVMIMRFAQEMNLSRYHWGTAKKNYGPHSTDIYISIFRYVVTFFKNKKIDNVLWAFCPNVDSVPNENWNIAKNYYPGGEYVDILGMDGYNWDIDEELAAVKRQTWTAPSRSFEQIFNPLLQQLKEISGTKPIFVFETASVDRSESNKKLLWLQDALEISKKWNIQGIIWFQVDKEEKWKLKQEKNTLVYVPQSSFQSWLIDNFKDFR